VTGIQKEIDVLRHALVSDKSYYEVWQANIAVQFQDEWQRACNDGGLPATLAQIHDISNRAADGFLRLLTSKGSGC